MPGPVVVALGDSITLGVGDGVHEPHGRAGWASHTATAVGAARFVNLARNGMRAHDLAGSPLVQALAARPDIVLVTAGGNDVLRGDYDAARVESELHGCLLELSHPGRTVLTLTLDRIGLFELLPPAVAAVMARRVDTLNGAIRAAAVGTGTLVIDGAAVFRGAGAKAWHIDRVHPSPSGHRAIAAAAVDRLSPWWPPAVAIPAAPPPPRLMDRVQWLVRHGAPWAMHRSRDLIPEVAQAVARDVIAERRTRLRGAVRA